MTYRNGITIDPGKRGGKPCIRGLRITVYDVLEYLASGMSAQEILDDFPDLTHDDIRACLSFTADRERKRLDEQELEERHVAGYRRNPPQAGEFEAPERDLAWGDEAWSDP